MAEPIYAIENICGGDNASGGGCGAPLGVHEVDKDQWDKKPGRKLTEFSEHNDNKVPWQFNKASEEGTLFVKRAYRPCSACYKRF